MTFLQNTAELWVFSDLVQWSPDLDSNYFNKIISDLWFSTARCGFGGGVSTRTPYLAAPSTAPAIPIPALACLPWGLGLLHS